MKAFLPRQSRVRAHAGGVCWLAVAVLLVLSTGPALAQGPSVTVDWASASSRPGAWSTGVQGGWPWSGLRAQLGLAQRVTLVGELDTAVFRRFQPSAGLGLLLVGTPKARVSLELGLGSVVQGGVLPQQGPSGTLRLRLVASPGPVGPYLVAGTRHTLLHDRTRTYRLGVEDPEVSVQLSHRWSPWLQVGLAFAPTRHFGFDVAIDWHFVDVGVVALTLPGVHFGIQVGNPGPRGEVR
ncbi:MAG: hypothetical protein CL928_04410 [Deltaproteobacteria bacterium]|nr:hypothetical protein [Deltaproteobacteria bacterium]